MVDPSLEGELYLDTEDPALEAGQHLGPGLYLEVDGPTSGDGERADEERVRALLETGDEEPSLLANLGDEAVGVVAEVEEQDAVLHPCPDPEEPDVGGSLAAEREALGSAGADN